MRVCEDGPFCVLCGSSGEVWLVEFFCMLRLNFVSRWMGMLLLCVVCLLFLHSLCRRTSLRGSESILFIENL